MQHKDHAMLLGYLLQRSLLRFFVSYGLGQEPLALVRFGPQLLPVGLRLGLAGPILLTPFLHVVLEPVQNPLDHGRALLTHPLPPSWCCVFGLLYTPRYRYRPDQGRPLPSQDWVVAQLW